jgi:hypothetical protein
VLEALQNVAKYARASAAKVTLCEDGPLLAFTVTDDGQGFDLASTPIGSGLQGITDRLAALGGTTTSPPPPATAPRSPAGYPPGKAATLTRAAANWRGMIRNQDGMT